MLTETLVVIIIGAVLAVSAIILVIVDAKKTDKLLKERAIQDEIKRAREEIQSINDIKVEKIQLSDDIKETVIKAFQPLTEEVHDLKEETELALKAKALLEKSKNSDK